MNIIINSEEFVAHLTSIIGVVDRKQTMPILGHVLIAGQSGEITLTATDLEVQISSSFKANISEDFSITLPGRKLFDILRSIETVSPHPNLDRSLSSSPLISFGNLSLVIMIWLPLSISTLKV